MAELTGVPQAYSAGTSKTYTTPFPFKIGTRGRDVDGNEYIFCEFGAAVSPGIWVKIGDNHVTTALAAGDVGRVGVVCGGPGPTGTEATSNLGGWVMVYGLCNFAQTSDVTDTSPQTGSGIGWLKAGAVVTSPAGTAAYVSGVSLDATRIYNAWTTLTPVQAGISGASDSSGPTSYVTLVTDNAGLGVGHTGSTINVFLNYPYCAGNVDNFLIGNPTSTGAA